MALLLIIVSDDGFFTSAIKPMNEPFDGNNFDPFSLARKDGLPAGVHIVCSSLYISCYDIPPESKTNTSMAIQKTLHGFLDKNAPQLPKELLKKFSTFY